MTPAPLTPEEHESRSLELLAQAEPLPLASPQRLARLVTAQVHAQHALLGAMRGIPTAVVEPAAKAAPRKTRKPAAKPAQEESASNGE